MAPSPELSDQGATLAGRYSIRRKLGSGSLGTVYLAHDVARGHVVALKVIRTDRINPEAVRDMQREFRAFASLNHHQIATAYDFGYTENEDLLPSKERRTRICSVWARVHTLSQLDNLCGIGYHSRMTRKLQELQHEILQLPEKDRIRLVEQLIASLDGEDDTDAEERSREASSLSRFLHERR